MKMRVILTIVGVITATPALALFWPGLLESSYGLADPDRFLVLTVVDSGMRADMNLISLVFDPLAIVILAVVIVLHLRAAPPPPDQPEARYLRGSSDRLSSQG
ncbi:hypothetical protein AB0J84_00580 [Micromonospora arborensis]|uniref:hypothetical protein n=1 Tax=Micromonospora arborensis TaxID=2116518 RepID=UPI00343BCD1B